jgi:hypothetical protein
MIIAAIPPIETFRRPRSWNHFGGTINLINYTILFFVNSAYKLDLEKKAK